MTIRFGNRVSDLRGISGIVERRHNMALGIRALPWALEPVVNSDGTIFRRAAGGPLIYQATRYS
jgi:hypothetical protein